MRFLAIKPILLALLILGGQEILQIDVSLVTVGVRVTDSRGRDVRGLKGEDFSVAQDGAAQKISFFSSDPQPITLGILCDRSSSMEASNKIDHAKDAARALVAGARDGSEFFYIEFNEKVRLAADFTLDRQSISSVIRQTVPDGGTSLYDAILEGLVMTGRAQLPRQVLVIISDGADQHSTHELAEIIRTVRESAIQIYTIGYFSKDEERIFRTSQKKMTLSNGAEVDNPRLVLEKLAEESGGISFFPKSDEELAKAVVQINEDLTTQYGVGFYPQNVVRDTDYHQLSVTVRGGRYTVRARPGYGTREFTPGTVLPKADAPRTAVPKVERSDGPLVFRDNFSNPNSGWPQRATAKYTSDGYRMTGENLLAMNGPAFRNFRAAVSITIDEYVPPYGAFSSAIPPNSAGGGLIFRQTNQGYYAFLVYPQTGTRPGFAIAMRDDEKKSSEIGRWPLLNRPARTRKIEVRCEGSECEFYDGGALLGRLKNVAVSEGRIGLLLGSKGEALFQNLSVEEIP